MHDNIRCSVDRSECEKIKLGYTEKMKICLGNIGTSTEAPVCLSIFALSQTYCNITYNLEIRNIFPAVSLGKIQWLLHNERFDPPIQWQCLDMT